MQNKSKLTSIKSIVAYVRRNPKSLMICNSISQRDYYRKIYPDVAMRISYNDLFDKPVAVDVLIDEFKLVSYKKV